MRRACVCMTEHVSEWLSATPPMPLSPPLLRTGNVGRSKVLRSADLFALFSSPVAQSMSLSTVGLTLSNWTSATFSHSKIDRQKRSCLAWERSSVTHSTLPYYLSGCLLRRYLLLFVRTTGLQSAVACRQGDVGLAAALAAASLSGNGGRT